MNKVGNIKKHSMLMLNDFYGNSMTNFNYLSDYIQDFKLLIGNDSKLKESFQKIYQLINETKGNFQNFYSSFSEYLKKEDQEVLNSKLTSSTTTNNSNYNQNKIKSSYEKIDSEFQKIEKVTKELHNIRKNNDLLRVNRIKLLESKLQDFCDEVKNIGLNNIHLSHLERCRSDNNISKIFENSESNNDLHSKINEISSMPSYSITVENSQSDNENIGKATKFTKLNHDSKENKNLLLFPNYKKNNKQTSNSNKNKPNSINNHAERPKINNQTKDNEIFIDQIMKLNIENKNEMIKLIESLLGKEESEKEINLHNQVNHSDNEEKVFENTIKKDS